MVPRISLLKEEQKSYDRTNYKKNKPTMTCSFNK